MVQDDEYIQTVMGLGLTLLQAKTYLALATLGKADVKTIAKASNVVRQDVYRIMLELQKLGLAEKIIVTPTMYKATPLRKALSTLLQQKIEKNVELQEKLTALIEDFEKNNTEIMRQENTSQFIITSGKALFLKRLAEATDAAQTSKDVIFSQKFFRTMLFYHLPHIKRALNRGVRIRLITEKPENEKITPIIEQDLKKNPLFELKYISDHYPVFMVIFDNKEANIRISEDVVPSFWSNNPSVVKLAVSYFEAMWKQAEKINPDQKQKKNHAQKRKTENNHRQQILNTQQS